MLNGISTGDSNQIQAFSALNAFKAERETFNGSRKNIEDNTSSGVALNDNDIILKEQNIEEIKKFARFAGEENLTDEDIKYGLIYGRSVIAEYSV